MAEAATLSVDASLVLKRAQQGKSYWRRVDVSFAARAGQRRREKPVTTFLWTAVVG